MAGSKARTVLHNAIVKKANVRERGLFMTGSSGVNGMSPLGRVRKLWIGHSSPTCSFGRQRASVALLYLRRSFANNIVESILDPTEFFVA